MKRICMLLATAALLASCDPCAAQDLNVRKFDRVVEVGDVTTTDRLPWYAGESVGYSITARSAGAAVHIPEGTVPVWLVLDATNRPYIVTTGTVVSATNGQVRFWVPAPEANLPPGTYYSWATVYRGTNQIGVLDRTIVRVAWRPGEDYEAAQPLTNVLDMVVSWFSATTGAVADEAALRGAADAGLSNLVGGLRTDLGTASNELAEAIAAETSAREGAGYLTGYTETDPAFAAAPAYGITTNLLAQWSAAYAWGDHAAAGYLRSYTETDPVFAAAPAYGITTNLLAQWSAAYVWGNHAAAGYLTEYEETDPAFAAAPAYGITTNLLAQWSAAYAWGDHAAAGYLTSYTETDPVFAAAPAYGITTNLLAQWSAAYAWGDHAEAGYLTEYTETDPAFAAAPAYGITTNLLAQWSAAYAWGDHAAAGYLTSYTETDPVFATAPAYGITTNLLAQWSEAYAWGDHAEAGYLTEETYQGTITGATITTGAAPAVVTNGGVLQFTVPVGGTGAQTTNFTGFALHSVYADPETLLLVTNTTLFYATSSGLRVVSPTNSTVEFVGDSLAVDGMRPMRGSTLKDISAAAVGVTVSAAAYASSGWLLTYRFDHGVMVSSATETSPAIWRAVSSATNAGSSVTSGWVMATGSSFTMTNASPYDVSVLKYLVQSNAHPDGQLIVTVGGEYAGEIAHADMDGEFHKLVLNPRAGTGDVVQISYSAYPPTDGAKSVIVKLLCASGLNNPAYYDRISDLHGQVVLVDAPDDPRQVSNKQHVEEVAAATEASAMAEDAFASFNRDLNGFLFRYSPLWSVQASAGSNGVLSTMYGGADRLVLSGGGTVAPRVVGTLFGTGETHVIYVAGSTQSVFGVETSTNMATWTNGPSSAILATNWVDGYTAALTVTNSGGISMFFRIANTYGGAGSCDMGWTGTKTWNGVTMSNWSDIAGAAIDTTARDAAASAAALASGSLTGVVVNGTTSAVTGRTAYVTVSAGGGISNVVVNGVTGTVAGSIATLTVPVGEGGGTNTTIYAGAEGLPLRYAYSTNIVLVAGTNRYHQVIDTLAGPLTLSPPTNAATTNDVGIFLRYWAGSNTVTWATNSVVGGAPAAATSGVTRVLILKDAGSTNYTILRLYP